MTLTTPWQYRQTFQRRLDRKADELMKALWHLGNQEFKCPHDAEKALNLLSQNAL